MATPAPKVLTVNGQGSIPGLPPGLAAQQSGGPSAESSAYVQSLGVIIPPDEIAGVIDKTAAFVAKNGDNFEKSILAKKKDQFEFLLPDNPYRAYFDKRVREIKEGVEEEAPVIPKAIMDMAHKQEVASTKKQHLLSLTQWGEDGAGLVEPLRSPFFVKHPYIAAVDLDVIKLTAQFVARNGEPFLLGLTQREKSPQFHFLKPTHTLFQYFTSMVENYNKILKPTPADLKKVKRYAFGENAEGEPLTKRPYWMEDPIDPHAEDVLKAWTRPNRSPEDIVSRWKARETNVAPDKLIRDDIYMRYMWNSNEAKKEAAAAAKAAEERSANMAIDWYDFQVVATIEFDHNEQYQQPVDFNVKQMPQAPMEHVIANTQAPIASPAMPAGTPLPYTGEMPPALPPVTVLPPVIPVGPEIMPVPTQAKVVPAATAAPVQGIPVKRVLTDHDGEKIKIVRNYDRNAAAEAQGQQMQKCPITGRLIPAVDMTEHLRVLLLDPQWQKERENLLRKAQKESAFAPMGDVTSNLASFVSRRPDIFGSVDDAVVDLDRDDVGASDPKKARLWFQG